MDIQFAIKIALLVLSIIIVVLVLLQQQESGFNASQSNVKRSRRGPDKLVYNLTAIFGIIFVTLSILSLFI